MTEFQSLFDRRERPNSPLGSRARTRGHGSFGRWFRSLEDLRNPLDAGHLRGDVVIRDRKIREDHPIAGGALRLALEDVSGRCIQFDATSGVMRISRLGKLEGKLNPMPVTINDLIRSARWLIAVRAWPRV